MSMPDGILFGLRRKLPLTLQSEAAECGLACLTMIAGFHGYHVTLAELRQRFPGSLKGITLAQLARIAGQIHLGTRSVRVELEQLPHLSRPCILHWNLNHFVVLLSASSRHVIVHDPARGRRKLPYAAVSAAFSGVALELWPNEGFQSKPGAKPIAWRALMGRISGLRRSLMHALLVSLALETVALIHPFYFQWVLDHVLGSGDRDLLAMLGIGFTFVLIVQQAIATLRAWLIMYLGTTLAVQWRSNIFEHLLRLPVEYFQKRHLGDVVTRFASIDQIRATVTGPFLEAILDGTVAVLALVVMSLYSPPLALMSASILAAYVALRSFWFGSFREATHEEIVHAARQQAHFIESIRGIKTIKLFERQHERRMDWLAHVVHQVNAQLRSQRLKLAGAIINGMLFGLGAILVVWIGCGMVLDGQLTVGMLVAFTVYERQFSSRVSALVDKAFDLKMLQLYGQRLADIVLTPAEDDDRGPSVQASASSAAIEVRQLRFRYAAQDPYLLDGIDLTVSAGEFVAIVGPSGGGKSTLVHLILGAFKPTHGEIRVGGVALAQNSIHTVRGLIGAVTQDDLLFAGTILENISFFDRQVVPERVEQCARAAAIYDDIAAMPMGFNTLVGDMGALRFRAGKSSASFWRARCIAIQRF